MTANMTKKTKKPTAKQITIDLVNLYYGTDHGLFFKTFHRDAAIKEYIDNLWTIYGPKEDIDDTPDLKDY
jgi:hypothetical protein